MAEKDEKTDEPLEELIEEQNQKLHIPAKLPVLLLRDIVVFPYMIVPLFVGREKSKAAIDQALSAHRMILLLTQKDMETEDPKQDEVYDMGTVALIMRMLKLPDGRIRILAQGLIRAADRELRGGERPTSRPRSTVVHEPDKPGEDPRERGPHPQRPLRPGEGHLARQEHPARGPDHRRQRRGAGPAGRPDRRPTSSSRSTEAQEILEIVDPVQRLKKVYELLAKELELLDVQSRDLDRGQGRDGQAPAPVFPPPADEGHPEGARRGQRAPGGDQGLPGQAEEAQGRRRGPRGAREADQPPGPDASRVGRDDGRPQLSRLDVRPALEQDAPSTTSTSRRPRRSSTRTTTAWTRSRSASSNTWPSGSSPRRSRARSSASSGRRASARPRSASPSPGPWAGSSSASRSAACATRPRSAATAGPTSGPCPAGSSRASAGPARTTPSS